MSEITSELKQQTKTDETWLPLQYVNKLTGRSYEPHHQEELDWVTGDNPRYLLAKGGEGSGKSTAGVIKDLERLRRGMRGILVAPDMPHFKKSLWPEFRAWCPEHAVIPRHRYRLRQDYEPNGMFTMMFVTGTLLYCGGIENPMSWEGPNVHFAHLDEGRRCPDGGAIKVLDGRIRLQGKQGEPPQLWVTTTPRKNWLFDYFGPIETKQKDPLEDFKNDSKVITLRTVDNEGKGSVIAGYADKRRQTLTEAEARVILDAGWEDLDDAEKFINPIQLWHNCRRDPRPMQAGETYVAAADAGVSDDSFGFIVGSRSRENPDNVVVRLVKVWYPPRGGTIDYGEVEAFIVDLCRQFSIIQISYDQYQLHGMMQSITNKGFAYCEPFSQQDKRLVADKQTLDLVRARRIEHYGDPDLDEHIENADAKKDKDRNKLRIVKRAQNLKIDLAVCLSMMTYTCLELNL